jgi:pyruvate formate lyase activating enzyme
MIKIGGLQKTTLIDFPSKISSTVFLIGCNFRCPFCYSPELVLPEKIKKHPVIDKNVFFQFLKERKGLIEGVCVTGGEPTINPDLLIFIKKIKKMGYLVKLDTNGSNPEMVKKLIKQKLLDYLAMDIKAPKEKYKFYSGIRDLDISKIEKSIKILKEGSLDYEFRTTVAPGISQEDIKKIVNWISPAKRYFLQSFYKEKEIINPKLLKLPLLEKEEILKIIEEVKSKFEVCELR